MVIIITLKLYLKEVEINLLLEEVIQWNGGESIPSCCQTD